MVVQRGLKRYNLLGKDFFFKKFQFLDLHHRRNVDLLRSDIRIEDFYIGSPRKDSSVKSTFEEKRTSCFTLKLSNMNTNINSGNSQQTNILEKALVKPSVVSNTESGKEEGIKKKQAERLAFHSKSFNYEILKLHDDAKVQHTLFMEKVNETKEYLVVKVAEIKSLIIEESKKMDENYKELHGKVDVLAGAIT
ncbi:unnamed protein product [Lactuca saligna]|uniref:Uncharacterized protein n=1 Tax=Lactuca saligna TaxID=75948 RepID=A0AA35UZ72_LACSI|nr:unnamed protein product [Lactuca saligna]